MQKTEAVQRLRKSIECWLSPNLSRQVFLNVGTLVAVALMLGAYHVWAAPSPAPQPQAVSNASTGLLSYQGYLTDADGEPLQGDVDITFRLYSASSGGTALWTEAHTGQNAVPVTDGLFNVMLGSLTPIPVDVWSSGARYLGIQIGDDAEMTPREKLGTVPHAMQAVVAKQLTNPPFASNNMGVHYLDEEILDEDEYLPFDEFEHTVEVPVRSHVFIVASASLAKRSGDGYMYADLRRNGGHFQPNTTRHMNGIPSWSEWAWNTVEIVEPGTYTYQMYGRGTAGLTIRWYRPQISILVIPVQ